jgi:hypothetical protein
MSHGKQKRKHRGKIVRLSGGHYARVLANGQYRFIKKPKHCNK